MKSLADAFEHLRHVYDAKENALTKALSASKNACQPFAGRLAKKGSGEPQNSPKRPEDLIKDARRTPLPMTPAAPSSTTTSQNAAGSAPGRQPR
jgi:hypothetical protein